MRVVIINAYDRTVGEAEVPDHTIGFEQLQALYSLIGHGCDIIERVPTSERETIFVDEEGLYRQTAYWKLDTYHQPLAGNGVVLGQATASGDLSGSTVSVEEMRERVQFLPRGR